MSSSTVTPIDIGLARRLKIRCISENGWFDNQTLLGDIKAAGGGDVSQYDLAWPPWGELHADNAAGFSALLELEAVDGTLRRILFDTGWGPAWMDRRFAEEGIDRLLRQGAIDCLVISHEHFDHFWGIGSTLKHCPAITIYIPEGFHAEGLNFIRQQGHTGELITIPPGQPQVLFPGCALASFPIDTLLQVHGEIVLYFRLADKGLGMVTGCGHAGALDLLDYGQRTFGDGDKIYAVYGGLHISPFEEWDENRERFIQKLTGYNIQHLGCNHCTGVVAAEKMHAAGLPLERGSARLGSKTDLFLGNGDTLEL